MGEEGRNPSGWVRLVSIEPVSGRKRAEITLGPEALNELYSVR